MLQLARASRNAFSAQAKYRRLRLREIEVMYMITVDECEKADVLLKRADLQVGEVRHILTVNGTRLSDNNIRFLPWR